MTELPDGSKTSFNVPAAIDAADLLRYYSFDLGGYPVEQLLGHWLTQYPADWIRLAVVEALYQGRYKAISVEQILRLWQRRQQAFCHFNREFERLVCNKIPHHRHLASRTASSSQPTQPEPSLPTNPLHRKVMLHLPGKQAISLLQTPAKIPPLRITPAANGSSASRLLDLVSPIQAASHPLPPFPVNHVDQPVGESDRTPCQPVADLRTAIAQPSPDPAIVASEQVQSASTPEVNSSEPISIKSPELSEPKTPLSQTASTPSPASGVPLNPFSSQRPTEDTVTAPSNPSPLTAARKSPGVKVVAERSPQTTEPQTPTATKRSKLPGPLPKPTAVASSEVKLTTERSSQAAEAQVPDGEDTDARIPPELTASVASESDAVVARSSESTRSSQPVSPEAKFVEAEPTRPVTPAAVPPRVVELPIWQRIQSDPLLTHQLTSSDLVATGSQPQPVHTAQPQAIATGHDDDPDCSNLGATHNGKDQFLEQIRQGIRFSLDLGLTNRSIHPKLRLLLSQMYQRDWGLFDSNQPIHQFVPTTDSPDFHGKLRAVAESTTVASIESIDMNREDDSDSSTSHQDP